MTTEEQPPAGTHCVVNDCTQAATVYVEVGGGPAFSGDNAIPMCDEHAAHWQDV